MPLKSRDEYRREVKLLRERNSKLSAACLRISASLDLDTVLSEVVDSARELTGAGYGGISTIGELGQPEDFVSSGYAPEEHRQLLDWTDGLRVFERFRELEGSVRLTDLHSYIRSLGVSPLPILPKTVQATALRHRGAHVGNFFLGGKSGGLEFTDEDEEVLVLFAAQAATAIANARTYRDEQRARADLEALIETSPVGVAVFDAKSGRVVSFNQEAKRIVGSLRMPDLPIEQLPDIITCRRADGREVTFQEFPLTQALSRATTVRAEEIVLQVPDGRSVTTLINATPIRAEDGAVESMVVTLQDLAQLQEMERLRAEFLGLVSHELQAPLMSIKGSTSTVLSVLPAPSLAELLQFFRIIDEQADYMRSLISDLLDAGHIETGTLTVSPEPAEVVDLVDQARKTYLTAGGRRAVEIDLPLDLPRVMADRQRIVQVMNNLLSNAARCSPESSPIRVAAVHQGVEVAISVSDEGQGVPLELLPHLFRKHVRMGGDRGIRGSGLGLAICKGLVEAHGGRIRAQSAGSGLGSRFTFTIPVAEDTGAGSVRLAPHPRRAGQEGVPVLVVDDDPQTLRYVREALAAAGYSPLLTGDPREVLRLVKTKKPRLLLLDLMLPGTDGIELMQRVSEMSDLPVIFVSAYGRDETIARALEMGAADYVVKPFSPTELVARVRAALRRHYEPPKLFRSGSLTIHYEDRRVTVAGRTVQLTATEFELLRALSVNAGRIMTYATLLRQVWNQSDAGDRRSLRNIVKLLRRKLGDDAAKPTFIFNERQVGYRMSKPDKG